MKICWDMLEGVHLTKNNTIRKGGIIYIEKEKCNFCGEPYLTQKTKPSKFCGHGCATIKDLTGEKFNKMKVLSFAYTENNKVFWKCECDCGVIKTILGNSLVSGHTKSCGCLQLEKMKAQSGKDSPKYKHGLSKTSGYACACSQKRRSDKLNQTPILTENEKRKIGLYYQISQYLGDWAHVDHIKPLSKGGFHHPDNLQILSAELNLQKSDKYPLTDEEQVLYKGVCYG